MVFVGLSASLQVNPVPIQERIDARAQVHGAGPVQVSEFHIIYSEPCGRWMGVVPSPGAAGRSWSATIRLDASSTVAAGWAQADAADSPTDQQGRADERNAH